MQAVLALCISQREADCCKCSHFLPAELMASILVCAGLGWAGLGWAVSVMTNDKGWPGFCSMVRVVVLSSAPPCPVWRRT